MKILINTNAGNFKAKVAKTFFQKVIGKMFSFSNEPIIFINKKSKRFNIHTVFCFNNLDVYWLSKNKKIIFNKFAKPFWFFKGVKAKYIIEIPSKNPLKIKNFSFSSEIT